MPYPSSLLRRGTGVETPPTHQDAQLRIGRSRFFAPRINISHCQFKADDILGFLPPGISVATAEIAPPG